MTAFESPNIQPVDEPQTRQATSTAATADGHALAARVLAELAGSFLVCFAIYLICSFGTSLYNVNMAFIAVGIGVTYAVVTAMMSGISGAQFNPAVTIASMLESKTRVLDGVLYIVAQLAGALAAGAALRFLLPTSDQITTKVWLLPAVNGFENGSVAYQTVSSVGVSFGIVLAIVVEVVAGLLIAGTAMRSTDDEGRPSSDYALAMGAAYGIGAAITYPVTGAALNPARATGIAVFAQGQGLNAEPLGQLWVFWVCPILAAAVVALISIASQVMSESARRKARAAQAAQSVDDAQDADGFVSDDDSAHQGQAEVGDQQPDSQGDADEGVERH
ncbi:MULTISPECIES: MIP/aquaporin family protein [Bifidobacterium]|uniref:MIP/aquaporin family protein n=1 Tax=Bifidobacterium TaxID=1678 RepID=UPI001BDC2FAF|nr:MULTISPECIES: aquaporin [Bifidobacterium]MBT1162513.1 aquaporin [Bifidobacterium sp. SO1]MBW3079339.1 aquaporin [Bifidobacterium simiiventris]